MKIGILGTGGVAQTLARRWSAAGHLVTLGSRDPGCRGRLGVPVAAVGAVLTSHDVVVNATPGSASLQLVEGIGAAAFSGKVLIDIANATTTSFELLYPNASLAEKLQAALPQTHVVKTLNTAAMSVMAEPNTLPAAACSSPATTPPRRRRSPVSWPISAGPSDAVVDLGGIRSARGPEHYFVMFAALMQSLRTPEFNIRLVV